MKTLLLLRHSIPERTGSDPGLSADGKLPPACCFVVCKSPTFVESCSFFS